MSEDRHGWDDVVDGQRGIFGGAEASVTGRGAMDDWIQARTQPSKEGLVIHLMCESCGSRRTVTPEYPELIAIKYGLQPHVAWAGTGVLHTPTVWGFDQRMNAWFPDAICPGACQQPLRPLITIAEADEALRRAQQSGWISPKTVQDMSKHCAAMQMRRLNGGG